MEMQSQENSEPEQEHEYNIAMWRLVYTAGVGLVIVLVYGLSRGVASLTTISVGLMTAVAALLSGGLVGFLFGVPHTRQGESAPTNPDKLRIRTSSAARTRLVALLRVIVRTRAWSRFLTG